MNKNIPQETRQQHQEEYNNLQRDLRMESEVKEKAKQLKFQNFYKSSPRQFGPSPRRFGPSHRVTRVLARSAF
jgi:hypothetical protein